MEFKYFGGSDVVNKLFVCVAEKLTLCKLPIQWKFCGKIRYFYFSKKIVEIGFKTPSYFSCNWKICSVLSKTTWTAKTIELKTHIAFSMLPILGANIWVHSVLERIWIKGSYLSQWLPQGERGPPKESKLWWIEILHVGSQFT